MYFITEGNVEIKVNKKLSFFREKGSFFGEVSLFSNSRKTTDIVAVDYCFVEVLNKKSINILEKTFPGIKLRIKKGLLYFGINH